MPRGVGLRLPSEQRHYADEVADPSGQGDGGADGGREHDHVADHGSDRLASRGHHVPEERDVHRHVGEREPADLEHGRGAAQRGDRQDRDEGVPDGHARVPLRSERQAADQQREEGEGRASREGHGRGDRRLLVPPLRASGPLRPGPNDHVHSARRRVRADEVPRDGEHQPAVPHPAGVRGDQRDHAEDQHQADRQLQQAGGCAERGAEDPRAAQHRQRDTEGGFRHRHVQLRGPDDRLGAAQADGRHGGDLRG